jgi:hypothetical protein
VRALPTHTASTWMFSAQPFQRVRVQGLSLRDIVVGQSTHAIPRPAGELAHVIEPEFSSASLDRQVIGGLATYRYVEEKSLTPVD